jgi:hypothetical protein
MNNYYKIWPSPFDLSTVEILDKYNEAIRSRDELQSLIDYNLEESNRYFHEYLSVKREYSLYNNGFLFCDLFYSNESDENKTKRINVENKLLTMEKIQRDLYLEYVKLKDEHSLSLKKCNYFDEMYKSANSPIKNDALLLFEAKRLYDIAIMEIEEKINLEGYSEEKFKDNNEKIRHCYINFQKQIQSFNIAFNNYNSNIVWKHEKNFVNNDLKSKFLSLVKK